MIQNMNLTLNQSFEDGTHILYVNGEYRGDSDIGKLMHDFNCTSADEMNFDLMAERTRYLKENPKGVGVMCRAMEELRDESYAEGKLDQKIEMAQSLYEQGISIEQIAKASKTDVETVKQWLRPKAV